MEDPNTDDNFYAENFEAFIKKADSLFLPILKAELHNLSEIERNLISAGREQEAINQTWKLLESLNKYDRSDKINTDKLEFSIRSIKDYLRHLSIPAYSKEQSIERFKSLDEDSFTIRFNKFFKRTGLFFQSLFSKPGSAFGLLFKSEKGSLQLWSHEVEENEILRYETLPAFFSFYELEFQRISKRKAKFYRDLNKNGLGSLLDSEYKLLEAESLEKELIENSGKRNKLRLEDFRHFCEIYDTAEYEKKPSNRSKKLKSFRKTELNLFNSYKNWKFTFKTLLEPLRLRSSILLMRLQINKQQKDFDKLLKSKISENFESDVKSIREFKSKLEKGVGELSDDKAEIKKYIVNGRYSINKNFHSYVENLSEGLLNQGFLAITDRLEYNVEKLLENIPDKSVIIKTEITDKPLSHKDYDEFPPKKLLDYKALPSFQKANSELKSELSHKVENLYNKSRAIHEGLDFCFDSAHEMINKEDSENDEILEVLRSGIKRLEENLNVFEDELNEIIENVKVKSEANLQNLSEELSKLEKTENLNEVRLKITQGIATTRGNKLWGKLKSRFDRAVNKVKTLFKWIRIKIKHLIIWVQHRLFLKKSDKEITTEVSNYLAESRQLLDELPIVYKRIYEPKPVNEINLFKGRTKELAALNKAFAEWQKGMYSASVILGEKGGGITSLINKYITENKSPIRKKIFKPDQIYYSNQDYIQLLKELELEDYIHSDDKDLDEVKDGKRIIVLDGIEKLFLRKVNGFDCLQSLLKLILATDDYIFWICTCTIHTWDYLNQTLRIQDYFDYITKLEDLDPEEISSIILKRNQISGYNLVYEPDQQTLKNKAYTKLNEEEKHRFLQDKYISQINKFARSNLSLALIYWIQMTDRVSENKIFIKHFEPPRFDFLQNLSQEKVFILSIIITHGWISSIDLSKVLMIEEEQARLQLRVLREDSIVLEKESDVYELNPILYRHVVNMLKAKNMLH